MAGQKVLPSIHKLEPLDQGGVIARLGFQYQDHIAALFCLEMLRKPCLAEVWCETHDDIVLLWKCNGGSSVEFVQVKSEDPNQFWSVALLCERTAGKAGTSVAERALARARCLEPSRFRMVTAIGVNEALKVLQLSRTGPARETRRTAMEQLEAAMTSKLGAISGPNGMDCRAWLEATRWHVAESCDAVENANTLELDRYLCQRGFVLLPEQREEHYKRLLHLVHEAAAARWDTAPGSKKITRAAFEAWADRTARDFALPSTGEAGGRLARKMKRAGLTKEVILLAEEFRLAYRKRSLEEDFVAPSPYQRLIEDLRYSLHRRLVALDSGQVEPGSSFLAQCLDTVQAVYAKHSAGIEVQETFAVGCMYDITERCAHRFGAPEP